MRIFVQELASQGSQTLDRDRSHYLCRVRRAKTGDEVELFDGTGHVVHAAIRDANKKAATLDILESKHISGPDVRLALLLCAIKGDAADRAVQKSVELGATEIRVLTSARSNIAHRERRIDHLQRVAISACEQCGQNLLPRVHHFSELREAVSSISQIIVLQPGADPLPAALPHRDTLVCIGPEGGWTQDELDRLKETGATFAGLGRLVLRAETAPLAALAAIRAGWGWEL